MNDLAAQELIVVQNTIGQQMIAPQQVVAPGATAVTNVNSVTLSTSRVGGLVEIELPGTTLKGTRLHATGTLNFDLTAVSSEDLTIALTGALAGDVVSLGVGPSAGATADVMFMAMVLTNDVVTVRAAKVVAGAVNPPSDVFEVQIIHFI